MIMNKKYVVFTVILLSIWALNIYGRETPDGIKTKSAKSGILSDNAIKGLKWRNIGPYRGGRVTAVAGHESQLFTYYMGVTGGGVWKTEDAGNHWNNISDGYFKTSSVGAISVSESSPNIVYVGMGESPVRGVKSSHGDGVYKSTDSGRSWKHLGLDLTRHISRIGIHPLNPDIVYVAAQGTPFAKTEERGIYKTTDGGKTWVNILFVNETTGANDICIDVNNPEIIYVAMWDHFRDPWQLRSGGSGSGIYKTTDGGSSWEELTNGLPGEMGKIGIAVSPANPERLWAIIEAEDGGLYRSDNMGKDWKLLSSERLLRTRSWYYMHIFADPLDEETVYILNAPMLKSIDGGESFTRISTPHGDNHDLWINPSNNKIMVEGNDGGANVSFTGGKTWSTQRNQPTAQFYRVNTDNRYFYRVYGGQQDNPAVAILSRTRHGGIGGMDWFSYGSENAFVAFDPDNPEKIYSTGGRLIEFDPGNENTRNIGIYPYFDLASNGEILKYRFNWNNPVLVSKHDKAVLYHGAQMVLRSENRGQSWQEISPDLTRNQKDKQGFGGVPFTNEGAGGEVYNTISYISESPHKPGVLWVGTDDGLVHRTSDNGKTWENVTPKIKGEAIINAIEISPHNPETVYISVIRHKFNDLSPYIYKTENSGNSWKLITRGISGEDYVRVVREDPTRKGLLFAGTFSGVYISVDSGENWQFLELNLPVAPVTDLKIQHNDLVAATEGRAFWILDDITPLREAEKSAYGAENHLFKLSDTYLISQGRQRSEFMAENPPNGASIYLNISPTVNLDSTRISLSIYDEKDSLVREIALLEPEAIEVTPSADEISSVKPEIMHGLNRVIWDLRRDKREITTGYFYYPGYQGIKITPGKYRVELAVGDSRFTQELNVKADPEYPVTDEYVKQQEILDKAFSDLTEMHRAVNKLQKIRDQINYFLDKKGSDYVDETREHAERLLAKISDLENKITQPKQTTIQDVINYHSKIDTQYGYLIEQIDEAGMNIVYGAEKRLSDLESEWTIYKGEFLEIVNIDIPILNKEIKETLSEYIVVN